MACLLFFKEYFLEEVISLGREGGHMDGRG